MIDHANGRARTMACVGVTAEWTWSLGDINDWAGDTNKPFPQLANETRGGLNRSAPNLYFAQQVNSEASGNAFIGPAIMDAGMEAVMRDQVWKPMLDAGFRGLINFESGVGVNGASGYSPVDEWSNGYSGFISAGSPRFNALTDLVNTLYTPQRNVLSEALSIMSPPLLAGSSPP